MPAYFRPKWLNSISNFDRNGFKIVPSGAAYTYVVCTIEQHSPDQATDESINGHSIINQRLANESTN